MKNKALYIVLAVLVIGLLGLYAYGKSQSQPPVVETNSQNENAASALPDNSNAAVNANANANVNANANKPANTPANTQGQFSGEADVTGDTAVKEVVYDGTKFTPATVTIKVGDIVVFKNQGTSPFRVASDPHPTHTNYPEFDSKSAVAAGKSYEFKFTKVGTWGYHDHMNPSATGTVKVTN
jgi:plastocyanin